jgi:ferrochelatase
MNMLQQPDTNDATETTSVPKTALPHAPSDHPKVTFGKIGILLANLGTPDHYSYWPMRRYLNEFLSDKRVIDYSPWIWQPLLQLVILTKRPFSSGAAYKSIWNEEAGTKAP